VVKYHIVVDRGWTGVRVDRGWSSKKVTTLEPLISTFFRFGGVVAVRGVADHPESPYSRGGHPVTPLYKSE